MSKKDFKSTASAIITKRPATLEEALKAGSVEDLEGSPAPTARATRKDRKPGKTGNRSKANQPATSKKAARYTRSEKPVRKEVSISNELEQKLKAARVALGKYENDIFNEALAEYLQRKDKEIKSALKAQLGL